MPRKSALESMMDFVQTYLSGKIDRMDFDLDFNDLLLQSYPTMRRQSPEIADCFVFYLSEEGYDQTLGMTDGEHKKLIRKQFAEFKSALSDGML